MEKIKTTIFIVMFLSGVASSYTKIRLIADGFVLEGVDGKVVLSEDTYFFEPEGDLEVRSGASFSNLRLHILHSTQLEKIEADTQKRKSANYKIWGRVTKYGDKNYVYVSYFLPLSKVKQLTDKTPQKEEKQQTQVRVDEPGDELAMPKEVLEQLTDKRPMRTEPSETSGKTEIKDYGQARIDFVFADRTGFVTEGENDKFDFISEGLGRGLGRDKIEILPCEQLERAQQVQQAEIEPVRFKVAGIMTSYKEKKFLLLHRAARVYDYGNFGR
jgi:hypothetical protein